MLAGVKAIAAKAQPPAKARNKVTKLEVPSDTRLQKNNNFWTKLGAGASWAHP